MHREGIYGLNPQINKSSKAGRLYNLYAPKLPRRLGFNSVRASMYLLVDSDRPGNRRYMPPCTVSLGGRSEDTRWSSQSYGQFMRRKMTAQVMTPRQIVASTITLV